MTSEEVAREIFPGIFNLEIFGRNFDFVLEEYNWIGGGTLNFCIKWKVQKFLVNISILY